MIIVSVRLLSAITGQEIEFARMHICNDSSGSARRGNYIGEAFIGRDTAALDRGTVSKSARVDNYPRQALHVWNLVRQMLTNMGYTKAN